MAGLACLRAVIGFHGAKGLLHYPCHGASPSGVDGRHGVSLWVVDEHGYAVGGRNAYAHAFEVCHEGVVAFKSLLSPAWGGAEQGGVHVEAFGAVHLVWQHEVDVVYALLGA